MNTVLLIFTLIGIVASSLQIFSLAVRFELPPFLSATLWGCFIAFIGSLLPGILGFYAPIPVSVCTLCVSVLSMVILRCKQGALPLVPNLLLDFSGIGRGPWNIVTVSASIVSLLLLSPYLECFMKLSKMFFSPGAELCWDAVSYHLPALVEFIQAHSFWTFEGPYQSYSFGFELIYGLSMLFCHAHWGVVIGHGISVVLLVMAIAYVTSLMLDTLSTCGLVRVNRLMVQLFTQAIWAGIIFRTSLDDVGNNDVFEAATLIAAFGYFLRSSQQPKSTSVGINWLPLLLGGVSLVLALATKSPALAFVPLFALMIAAERSDNRVGMRLSVAWLLRAELALLPVLVVGTFFLWHNISNFGSFCDPELVCGFRDTLLHHLRDPRILKPTLGEVLFLGSVVTVPLLHSLWRHCARSAGPYGAAPLLWLAALYLSGAAAFSYTPFAVSPDYDVGVITRLSFQNRKAMVMFAVTAISIALSFGCLCASFCKRSKSEGEINEGAAKSFAFPQPVNVASYMVTACLIGLIAVVPAIDWWWHRTWPLGLAGYEHIKGLPRTEIYKWVQTLDGSNRIYSSGLRPYGLFGVDYRNRLFYDLHSHILKEGGEERLLSVLNQFEPDLILISVDPHPYTGAAEKPVLVEWMKAQSFFSKIFEDQTVSAFRVHSGWRAALQKRKTSPASVRMHS